MKDETEHPKFGRLPDGRWNLPSRKKIHNVVTNDSNVSREVPFRNATEQIMFQIFSRERGGFRQKGRRRKKRHKSNRAQQ